ncbi:MAG TPA: HAD-IIIA family hydrolase [Candidatus Andersenbacteria bacterium]|nr:HAD-IIIA family hydrolase [Candidatus Andersenbacteria bacterium]
MRSIAEKITSRETLAPQVAAWREAGKIVGFTSGSFDLLHAGHAAYLEEAKRHSDVLIVAVNTDESVRSYKGPDRPLVPEDARVKMIAALESVDFVFTFNERRNRANIETIKPSLYIKAGDYTPEQLTSGDVVKKYGGDILLLPMKEGMSTTNLVKKIAKIYGPAYAPARGGASAGEGENDVDESIKSVTEKRDRQKAILVDRDGTINKDIEYLHEPEKFELLPNVGEGLQKFQELGYRIVIVSLQAGIGIGYFTKEDFFAVNRAMFKALKPYGITIDKIYFATHSKTEDGKNPKVVLVERAREELDLDLSQSVVIGDKTADLAAGADFSCVKIGVKTGKGLADGEHDVTADYMAADLLDAATWLEKH